MSTSYSSLNPGSADAAAVGAASLDHDGALDDHATAESNQVLERLRAQKEAVVERMQPQIDAVSSFARNDPTKAVLIAAATGAALMAIIALLTRSSSRASAARSVASIRDAALSLADRAQLVAAGAIDAARRRSGDVREQAEEGRRRFSDLQQRASDAADSVAETVSDTLQSLREQAAPVVDRLRPQFEAVANYAKEDPARAAIGLATAGAAILGLIALIGKSRGD